MASSANAVFTEVLELQVDTSQFQADMDSLVTMYTNAMTQMNAASAGSGGMSTGMAQLATQLQAVGMQAQQSMDILGRSANMAAGQLLDVASAAATVVGSLTTVGAAATTAGNTSAEAGYKAGISWENFGRQLQRTMMRLPAMLIVATAMAAVFEAIKAPIDFVVDGFKNLEASPLGDKMRENVVQLDKMKERFESITALPVFQYIGEQLDHLLGWLKSNQASIESFLAAIGALLKDAVSGVVDFIKAFAGMPLVQEGLRGIAAAAILVGSGLMQAVNAMSALIKLSTHGTAGILNDPKGFVKAVAQGGFTNPGATVATFFGTNEASSGSMLQDIDDWQKNALKIGDDQDNALAALNGRGKPNTFNPPPVDHDKTGQVKAEWQEKLAEAKAAEVEAQDKLTAAIHRGDEDEQSALPKRLEAIETWKRSVAELTTLYKGLYAAAVRSKARTSGESVEDQNSDITANNATMDKYGVSLSVGPGNPAEKQATAYQDAATDANTDNRKAKTAEELNDLRVANKAAEEILKERYKNNLVTVADYYEQKKALDQQAYLNERTALVQELDQFKQPDDKRRSPIQAKIDALDTGFEASNSEQPQKQADDQRKVTQEIQKATDALNQQVLAYDQILEREEKSTGHRREALSLERQILGARVAQARHELNYVDQSMAGPEAPVPGTPGYARGMVQQQQGVNALTQAYVNQATGAVTMSAAMRIARQNAASTSADLAGAQMKEASNPGSVSPLMMTQLEQSADAAAAALRRVSEIDGPFEQFKSALSAIAGVFSTVKTAADEYAQGFKKGGVLGGIGEALAGDTVGKMGKNLSSLGDSVGNLAQTAGDTADKAGSALGSAGSAIGAAGPIGAAIGTAMSVLSSLMEAAVQRMVDHIEEKLKSIQTQVDSGQIGLGQEITELQAEKQSAIETLGGSKKKGAQQALNSLLQQLDDQIGALLYQQQQIIQNFNNMANAGGLDTLTGTFSTWYNTWNSINQQVKEYVDAGGSIATANQFLNQQLAVQQLALQNQLTQGDQTALNDAIQLNQLLTQRVQMMKQEAQTEFGIVNADSVERQASQAVAAGNQLQTQRYNFQQQLLQMNENITLDQQRLSIEGQIFNVSGNIQQLWAKLNADNISSLNQQVAQYKDMQQILAATAGMVFSGPISNIPTANLPIPGEPSVAGSGTNITVNVTTTGNGINSGNAGEIGNAIARGIRNGTTNLQLMT